MHEFAITKALLKSARQACDENGITDAKSLTVEVGALTTYKKDPIIYYFEALKPNSPQLRNATIEVIELPGRIRCRKCGSEEETGDATMVSCTGCGSFDVEINGGDEIRLKSIVSKEK